MMTEQKLEKEIQVNIAYRWYLGLDLEDSVSDHCLLCAVALNLKKLLKYGGAIPPKYSERREIFYAFIINSLRPLNMKKSERLIALQTSSFPLFVNTPVKVY
jgi:hypothetical protein